MSTYQQSTSIEYDLPFALGDIFRVAESGTTHQHLKNISSVIKIRGELNIEDFLKSMESLFKRQESFRTIIVHSEDFLQVRFRVFENKMPDITLFDRSKVDLKNALDEARGLASHIAQKKFSFDGSLLSRAFFFILPEKTFIVGIVTHHLISDVLSHPIMWQELMSLYSYHHKGTQYPPDHSVQYQDYVRERLNWQNGWKLTKDLEYWTSQMDEFSRRSKAIDVTESVSMAIPPPVLQLYTNDQPSFADKARHYRVTAAMLVLAYFTVVLACWGKEDTISFRIIRDERAFPRYAKLVGFLSTGRPLAINVRGNPTFEEIVARTKSSCIEMFLHPWTPDEVLLQCRNDKSSSLFNFIYEGNELSTFHGLEMEHFGLNVAREVSSRNIFAFIYRSDSILGIANCRPEYCFRANLILKNMHTLMQLSIKNINVRLDELIKLMTK